MNTWWGWKAEECALCIMKRATWEIVFRLFNRTWTPCERQIMGILLKRNFGLRRRRRRNERRRLNTPSTKLWPGEQHRLKHHRDFSPSFHLRISSNKSPFSSISSGPQESSVPSLYSLRRKEVFEAFTTTFSIFLFSREDLFLSWKQAKFLEKFYTFVSSSCTLGFCFIIRQSLRRFCSALVRVRAENKLLLASFSFGFPGDARSNRF